jgi:hypothetical protein
MTKNTNKILQGDFSYVEIRIANNATRKNTENSKKGTRMAMNYGAFNSYNRVRCGEKTKAEVESIVANLFYQLTRLQTRYDCWAKDFEDDLYANDFMVAREIFAAEFERIVKSLDELYAQYPHIVKQYYQRKNFVRNQLQQYLQQQKLIFPKYTIAFAGACNKPFTDNLNQTLYQGYSDESFKGTCSLCSLAHVATMLGTHLDEKQAIKLAKKHNLCTNVPISIFDYLFNPERVKEIASHNGGSSIKDILTLLNILNFRCADDHIPSLETLQKHLDNGECIILAVPGELLNRHRCAELQEACIGDQMVSNHVVTVMGTVKDENNNVIGIWLNDTGSWNTSGPAAYCNKKTYELWRNCSRFNAVYVQDHDKDICIDRGEDEMSQEIFKWLAEIGH